jgi:cyclopropane fatty-acyl-phospholipid synthase-like methyltransferase
VIPDPLVRRVIAAHGGDRVGQAHVAVRTLTCPVHPVIDLLPRDATILEVGCGHGLFTLSAALDAPARRLVGIDIDADKILLARDAARRLGVSDRVDLRASDGSLPAGPFDAVLCVDVLYLLGADPSADLLRDMAAVVRPGGTVVVKEMSDRPAWKARWNHVQEVGATRVFSYTEGDHLEVLTPDQITGPLRAAGLHVTQRRVDRWYPYPHELFVGTRPSA